MDRGWFRDRVSRAGIVAGLYALVAAVWLLGIDSLLAAAGQALPAAREEVADALFIALSALTLFAGLRRRRPAAPRAAAPPPPAPAPDASASDAAELEKSRSEVAYLQNFDPVTRLPNARHFQQMLTDALRRAVRSRTGLAVLAVGLDRFHLIFEAFGRATGNKILAAAGERLARSRDAAAAVGRLEGESFAVVVEDVGAADDAVRLSEWVRTALAPEFAADGRTAHVSASVGVARFPQDGAAAEQLLQHAESALEDARRSGESVRPYRAELSEMAHSSVHLETGLRRALLQGGLECHFQPQVRLDNGAWIGAEALMRWRLGDCWISPERFIPIAEESGIIVELGRWMLWDAAGRLRDWRARGLVGRSFRVAVNLAGAQLDAELPGRIRGLLEFTGLGRRQLCLELTETIVMSKPQAVARLLAELREMGVCVALDDFGVGTASLAQLRALPLDELKLDRAFVSGLPGDRSAMAIARSIVALADALQLRVVAEGIETERQRRALLGLGCRYGQGHLFAAALPAAAFAERLAARLRPGVVPAREAASRA